jgi:ankyrin repeat protein
LNANLTDKPSATDNYFGSLSNENEHKIKMREMHSRVAQDMEMFYYPIHIAVEQDFIDLVKLLLDYKQKLDMEIKEPYTKRTPLHIAAGKCSIEVLFNYFLN